MARQEFPARVRREAAFRAQGVCESHLMTADIADHFSAACNNEPFEYDHVFADCLGGDPTLENCAYLCRSCHKIKTRLDASSLSKRRKLSVDRERARARKAARQGRGKKSIPSRRFAGATPTVKRSLK